MGAMQRFPLIHNGWALTTTSVNGYGVETFAHGLGRTPVGYLVISSDAPRPTPGLISADALTLGLDFGAVSGSVTLLVW